MKRLPLLLLGGIGLVTGLIAGIIRLGFLEGESLGQHHGPLMVSAFLGTLICLERAVALNKVWGYLGPILCGAGGVVLLAGAPEAVSAGLFWLAGVHLVIMYVALKPKGYTLVMIGGAWAWVTGNALWILDYPISTCAWWWAAFLILTILGERLELGRHAVRSKFRWAILILLLALYAGGALSLRLAGAAQVGLAAWFIFTDIARRTIRQPGLPRYAAVCMFSAYAWLAFAGVLSLIWTSPLAALQLDAVLHALFLGFVIPMVFAHAPIILPAVLGIDLPFRRIFYLHWLVLQAALIVRVAGDLTDGIAGWQWGGLATAGAIVLFVLNSVGSVLVGKRHA